MFGGSFQAGLTVTVTFPNGGTGTLSGTQIQNVSSGSFTMIITLGTTGTFGIRVNNPDGGRSNTFNFTVQNSQPAPSISSISPSSPTRRDGDQSVTVFGSNFQSGLTVTVLFPGGSGTLSGTQIQSVSSGSFTMIVTLNLTGQYSIRVNNPDGKQSNTFGFTVQSAPAPQISSISPSSPTKKTGDQSVSVFGSNFQPGLTVTVFFPGGSSNLSGTQIQSVSSGSFTMLVTLNVAGQYGIRVNNPDGSQSNTFNFTVQNPPSPQVTSISPATPTRRDTDQSVSVFGSNFQSGLTVTVFVPGGGTATLSGTQIQSVSSGSFTMIITLNVDGTYGIRVNNPDGGQSATFNFSVQNPISSPQITSVSPASPTQRNTDQNVTVNGSSFQSGLTLTVFIPGGGTATLSGTQIQSVTATSFTMVVTLNVTGTYGIRVNNPDGGQSNTFNFVVQNPSSPQISSISPSSPTRRDVDQNVIVNGNSFQAGLTVTVFIPGGATATLSGTQIQSVTSGSFTMVITLNLVGTYGIRVNNPDGGQSSTFNFSVQNPISTPQINSVSPASPLRRDTDQNVSVTGSGFQSGLTVTVFIPGGGTATLSGTQIQGVTSTSFTMVITLNLAGTYGIRVNNPDGGQSNTFNFTVQNSSSPQISSVSPASPTRRDVDQNVTVNGSGFQPGLTVTVFIPGGSTATLSGTQIQGVASGSFTMVITLNLVGTYGVRVNNPDGGQSNTLNFNVQNAVAPQITSISPDSPTRADGDQSVNIFGSGFQQGLTVTVFYPGGNSTLSGTQIQSVSSGSFTMLVTLNIVGAYGIRVNNPDGGQSNTFNFQVQGQVIAPQISSISPTSPSAGGFDQNVTVFGSNFQPSLTVSVTFPGGGSATLSGTQIQSVTANSFVMRITVGAAGVWSIRANNPDGGQSNVFTFTAQSVVQQPSVSSLNPSVPFTASTDQDVTVLGSNFQPNLTVSVNFPGGGSATLSGSQIQNVTASSFVLRITLGAAGGWSMRINNPDGGQSAPFNFNVTSGGQGPAINSINPAAPTTNGADQNVTVSGGNFKPGLRVDVGFPSGGVATLQGSGQIQNVTANSFLMRITLNAVGGWTIRVINPDGTQSGQFAFNVQASGPQPAGLPTSVLSPVIGPLRVTTSNQAIADGKWEFDQHKTGYHSPTGGISLSNDTFAWDVNLYTQTNSNADAGRVVFAVADGEVVSYVGTGPGSGPGAVLIAHPSAQNPVWFSGYLHMTNVRVSLNQQVNPTTVIGDIGRVGANNDHLHFVVYSGQDTRGNLISFNAAIIERPATSTNLPTISLIEPSTVEQSGAAQLITISGTNFQPNSIIEGQAPSQQYFTVTSGANSGDEAKIVSITPSTITALVNFPAEGTYAFSVINGPSGVGQSSTGGDALNASSTDSEAVAFAVSSSNTVTARPSGRTPVILIPGIMGSRISKRERSDFRNLWLGGSNGDERLRNNLELKNDVEDPNNYRDIADRPVVATEILRNLDVGGITVPKSDFYDRLINYLTGTQGYTLYKDYEPNSGKPIPERRTIKGCDTSQVGADLFIFPYDWRNSNWTSARDLYEYVQCIKKIRKDPANFKVDIIAHSMGGLVARRYILNFPGDHYVDRMVTLGTPWLGAPKFLNVLEFGGELRESVSAVILPPTMKELAPYIRGAHELIPSKAYVDDLVEASKRPLGEDGWNDFDFDVTKRTPVSEFDFSRLRSTMNYRYANRPGDATHTFHKQPKQDDWTGDTSGVSYYNFVGYGKDTIISLIAKHDWFWGNYFDQVKTTDGDGTVPLVSALRKGVKDYRGPIKAEKGFPLSHGDLVSEHRPEKGSTFRFINCVVNVPDAGACISNLSASQSPALKSAAALDARGEFSGEPYYQLKVLGSRSVTISDSFGNTTNPLSTSLDEGVSTVQTDVTGDVYLTATFPLDQKYRVVIKSPGAPISVSLTKSDGQIVTEATRYIDLTLPANVLALLEITPQGVTLIKYDSDGDGTYETTVNPTASVTGVQAQDLDAPVVSIRESAAAGGSQVVVEAADGGTGVQQIMYSVDGKNYQPYTGTLTLNVLQNPAVYAFADDKVGNRSGVTIYYLAPTTGNQIDNAQFFVRQHYLDFLGREPDASGLDFWTKEITQCGADSPCREVKRINVSAAFFLSIEFQQTGYLAYRAHKAAFGNLQGKPVPISREEMLQDAQVLGSGVVVNAEGWEQKLEQNKQAYFEQLALSQRFSALYPASMTPEQFVDALNANSGGVLSAGERDALVAGLKESSKTRAQVLRALAENQKLADAEKNMAFVLMQYFGYLRRNPDVAPDQDFSGWQFWLNKLNQFNGNFIQAEMVKAFLDSIEYRTRFVQNSASAVINGAVFVSQSVPTVVKVGEHFTGFITMRNTGSSTWTPDAAYRLGTEGPHDNDLWGLNRSLLTGPVAPESEVTFNIPMTAPATPGTYTFTWRMVRDGVEWFGEVTPTLTITVSPPSTP